MAQVDSRAVAPERCPERNYAAALRRCWQKRPSASVRPSSS